MKYLNLISSCAFNTVWYNTFHMVHMFIGFLYFWKIDKVPARRATFILFKETDLDNFLLKAA